MANDSPGFETTRQHNGAAGWPHRWTRIEEPSESGVVAAYPTVVAGAGPAAQPQAAFDDMRRNLARFAAGFGAQRVVQLVNLRTRHHERHCRKRTAERHGHRRGHGLQFRPQGVIAVKSRALDAE